MGLGERRGGRRAGGHRRRAHHRHNHHRNRHRHHHHGGRGFHGARPVLRFGWSRRGAGGGGGVGGGSVVPISGGHYALLIMLIMAAAFGFIVGMTLANIGGWVSTTLGIVGMFILFASFIFITILVVIRCNMMKLPPAPAEGEVEAGNANITVSTVTIDGSTTASQIGETTSYTSQVSAFQPGGVAMGMQPGYAGGLVQPPPPTQSFTVAPYPPAQIGGAPYPPVHPAPAPIVPPPLQPVVPPPGTYNYPVQSLPGGNVGVAIPNNPDGNNDVPPPSYNDVISGNVR
ncbi:uncharacterized protein LOC129269239 [Lytechinus pictus]|uniref:uncharacterized protein LOC129269239 n=1 Tax=Lytechinus pictus TaxID=7653 RepID=UPI0030B9E302